MVEFGRRLGACLSAWDLRVAGRLDGGSDSAVFGCVTSGGDEVVVKLAAAPGAARAEAAALDAWAGTGAAVRMIGADLDLGALLLRRIRPGAPLPAGDPQVTEVAAGVLSRLHRVRPAGYPFPALGEVYPRLERRARADARHERRVSGDPGRGAVGLARLAAARAAVRRLCATAGRPVLLHGDFLPKNLLHDGTGYLAIDPLPCVGDPCADVGFFAAGQPPAAAILDRAAAIAGRLGLDPDRARRWAAVWTVIQASQAWRDDQSDLEECLSCGDFERLLREPPMRG